MTSAKITRCRHYFHGVCLRKWLYVQDRCPLCHEIIMHQEPTASENPQQPPLLAAIDEQINILENQQAAAAQEPPVPLPANAAAAHAAGAHEVGLTTAHISNISIYDRIKKKFR